MGIDPHRAMDMMQYIQYCARVKQNPDRISDIYAL
jgi:hypothetical protein